MLEALEIFKQFHNTEEYENPQVFRKGSEKIVNGIQYGIPLYFLNYNGKKPFLKGLTLKNKGIYTCDYEEALLRHNFYHWLLKQPNRKSIYMYYDGEISINENLFKSCVYIVIEKTFIPLKGRVLNIIDYDVLTMKGI